MDTPTLRSPQRQRGGRSAWIPTAIVVAFGLTLVGPLQAAEPAPAPAAAPSAAPAPAPTPAPASPDTDAPAWLRDQLREQVQNAFAASLQFGQFIYQPPETIILRDMVLEPRKPFGWAELAHEPAGGPHDPWPGRLTAAEATLTLAVAPIPDRPLHIVGLTLDRAVLIGAAPQNPAADGPQVATDADRANPSSKGSANQAPVVPLDIAGRRQLRTGFAHLDVAVQTLPPTVSITRLAKLMPLERLTIRGGQIVGPPTDAHEPPCGIDLQTVADADGQWRFSLTLSSIGDAGQTRVQTQGYCTPDQGTITMTGVKFLGQGPDGKFTELDAGRVHLKLSITRGPADADHPKPRVDTREIDNLPSQYLSTTPAQP